MMRLEDYKGKYDDLGIDFLHAVYDSWQVDEKWSLWYDRGFAWWAKDFKQQIWIEPGYDDDGETIFRAYAVTDFIRDVDVKREDVQNIISTINMSAALTALVPDEDEGRIRIWTAMSFYEYVADWAWKVFVSSAILQPIEAQMRAPSLAKKIDAVPDTSPHPQNGNRLEMDDMLGIVESMYVPMGEPPSRWKDSGEFEKAADFFSQGNAYATSIETGLTLELSFGEKRTSIITATSREKHPQLGHGLNIRMYLPLRYSHEEAASMACQLNQAETGPTLKQHLLGAWCSSNKGDDSTLVFTMFVPNLFYFENLLLNMLMSTAIRANWTAAIFLPDEQEGNVQEMLANRFKELDASE